MKISFLLVLICLSAHLFSQSHINSYLDGLLVKEVPNESNPGLTIGVIQDGKLIYHDSRGSVNLEYEVPYNDSTVFGLASVTKQFTSACVGILAYQGKLSIYDDVRKYVPELAFYGDTIRIKNLLNHTSGIRNHNVLLDLAGFDFKHRGYTNKMIQELMFRQSGVNNVPGEKMLYSNTNYVLLALIIERVSGMTIHQFAKKELFEPLDMTDSFYESDLDRVVVNRAYPYYKEGDVYKHPTSLTLCIGAGGMKSTVLDLAKWTQVFLDKSHPFSQLKAFLTQLDTLNNGEKMKHARGMFISPYKGYKTFNHSGRGVGMRSQFICIPELNIGVVVYSNSEHIDAVDVSYKILDLFINEPIKEEEINPSDDNSPIQLHTFAGTYQELNSDLRMEIFVENDTLKALSSLGRIPNSLTPTRTTSFSRADNPSVTYSFFSQKELESQLHVDFGGAIFYFEKVTLREAPNQNLAEYTGTYYSPELEVTYSLQISDNQLTLSYPNHKGLVLTEGVKDTFGANRRTKYAFKRNEEKKIIAFEVSAEGTVKNILFEKIN